MIRTVSRADLNGFRGSGIVVRDHFRKVPENAGGAHYCLGPLRTLAETTIEVGSGFPMHDHAEMEIVSYVCQGTLAHEDTLGHRGRLGPGDVQAMTTGTGIRHSEVNAGDVPVRLYQVWNAATTVSGVLAVTPIAMAETLCVPGLRPGTSTVAVKLPLVSVVGAGTGVALMPLNFSMLNEAKLGKLVPETLIGSPGWAKTGSMLIDAPGTVTGLTGRLRAVRFATVAPPSSQVPV